MFQLDSEKFSDNSFLFSEKMKYISEKEKSVHEILLNCKGGDNMEKPGFTTGNLEACTVDLVVSLACIAGGAGAYAACGFTFLAEIAGDGGALAA